MLSLLSLEKGPRSLVSSAAVTGAQATAVVRATWKCSEESQIGESLYDPHVAEIVVVFCDFRQKPDAVWRRGSERRSLAVEWDGACARIAWPHEFLSLPDVPTEIVSAARSLDLRGLPNLPDSFSWFADWTALCRRNIRTFLVPLAGLRENTWCDGILAHIAPTGRVRSFLDVGCVGRLLIPPFPHDGDECAEQRGDGWRATQGERIPFVLASPPSTVTSTVRWRCAQLAVRERIGDAPFSGLILRVSSFSKAEAVAVALVRQIFANHRDFPLFVQGPTSSCSWPPAWKRLSENAGMRLVRDALPSNVDRTIDVVQTILPLFGADHGAGHGADDINDLLSEINRVSDVIPRRLGS